ncbi:hypothetical protein HDU96_005024 [Phlyctochytrium bullatum]|nr:hypothetical protein HDU96_005024 [Phlyctochytrium bullatum]
MAVHNRLHLKLDDGPANFSLTLNPRTAVFVSGRPITLEIATVNDSPIPIEVRIDLFQVIRTANKQISLKPVCGVELGLLPTSESKNYVVRFPLPDVDLDASAEFDLQLSALLTTLGIPLAANFSPQFVKHADSAPTDEEGFPPPLEFGMINAPDDRDGESGDAWLFSSRLLGAKELILGEETRGILQTDALFSVESPRGQDVIIQVVSDQPCSARLQKGDFPTWATGTKEYWSCFHHNGHQELRLRVAGGAGRHYLRLFGDNAAFSITARKEEPSFSHTFQRSGNYWKRIAGAQIPADAVTVGNDTDGKPLYVARAFINGGLHIGKMSPSFSTCLLPYGGAEMECFGDFEILCGIGSHSWVAIGKDGKRPENAFVGGYEEDGRLLYVSRAKVDKVTLLDRKAALTPGKCRFDPSASCNIPFDGKEVNLKSFEVLVVEPSLPTRITPVAAKPVVADRGDEPPTDAPSEQTPNDAEDESSQRNYPPPPAADVSVWQ